MMDRVCVLDEWKALYTLSVTLYLNERCQCSLTIGYQFINTYIREMREEIQFQHCWVHKYIVRIFIDNE